MGKHTLKPSSKVKFGFMSFDVLDYETGKSIHFDIDLGKITLPHYNDLAIKPNQYRVIFTNKAIHGDKSIGGMNKYAAKDYGIDWTYGDDVVLVAQQTTAPKGGLYKDRHEKLLGTIAHEIIEAELMKHGMPYHIAHMNAMEYEKGVDDRHPEYIRVKADSGYHLVYIEKEQGDRAIVISADYKSRNMFAGAEKDGDEWRIVTDYVYDGEALDDWWESVRKERIPQEKAKTPK
jgi:hypothetical protein